MLNRLTQSRNTREEKKSTKSTRQENDSWDNTSIITLNVNGLNAPTKDTD